MLLWITVLGTPNWREKSFDVPYRCCFLCCFALSLAGNCWRTNRSDSPDTCNLIRWRIRSTSRCAGGWSVMRDTFLPAGRYARLDTVAAYAKPYHFCSWSVGEAPITLLSYGFETGLYLCWRILNISLGVSVLS